MDLATRYRDRARTQGDSHLLGDGPFMPDDSGGESEPNLVRRKFQRTTVEPSIEPTFRKPSNPASAVRAGKQEHRTSFSDRRKSTLRENVRIPSGPLQDSSPGKRRISGIGSIAPPDGDPYRNVGTFQSRSNADSHFYNSSTASTTYAAPVEPRQQSADFLPAVNFDDLQTSIKTHENHSSLLNDFPAANGGGRILTKRDEQGMAKINGFAAMARPVGQQLPETDAPERRPSLRVRLTNGKQGSAGQSGIAKESVAPSLPSSSLRNRRQSSVPQAAPTSASGPTRAQPSSKPPRKSVGPGVLTNMMDKESGQTQLAHSSSNLPDLTRESSFRKLRRQTINPAASAGAELPRLSTLTATTQARQNKVKSLLSPPRDDKEPSGMSPGTRPTGKGNRNEALTPSSGNRRQSVASGRASGLGARTISPTDARRMKRLSTMHPPPMPTASVPKEPTPTPLDYSLMDAPPVFELPRLAQPSPSLIPRRSSNTTSISARASPEGRQDGGASLKSKSSQQSLVNVSTNSSSSRLPTAKTRSTTQSGSSLGQYSEHYGGSDVPELVPPVPAIPKAYDSPKDLESKQPFFSTALRSPHSDVSDSSVVDYFDAQSALAPWMSQSPSANYPTPSETDRQRSESVNHSRKRTNTLESKTVPLPPPSAPPAMRTLPDPDGRRNNNLQPLRLPPLNLAPFNKRNIQSEAPPELPRPSQETDAREDCPNWQTPEPKLSTQPPTTPMTASKATFSRRQDELKLATRSATSHYALRDVMGMDADGNIISKFWDESGAERPAAGVPPMPKQRQVVTPFASGSMPKGNGDYTQMGRQPSGEIGDHDAVNDNMQTHDIKPQRARPRAQTGSTVASVRSTFDSGTPVSVESSIVDQTTSREHRREGSDRKEASSSSGGLRRKLSLGWRRSNSKNAEHAEHKSTPEEKVEGTESEREWYKLQKQRSGDMPPSKLAASDTWSGGVSTLPTYVRNDADARQQRNHLPRSSQVDALISSAHAVDASGTNGVHVPSSAPTGGSISNAKTRSQHSEQPTPVASTTATRSSSWANLGNTIRGVTSTKSASSSRGATAANASSVHKDKDDVAADDEMLRLSRKRKDVDSVARESDELRKRAIARNPVTAEQVLHDRSLTGGSTLNVFERGEIVDYEKDGIYFTGTKSARKIIGNLSASPTSNSDKNSGNNFGYDDERGDYNIVLGDHLAYRYEVVDVLGKGSFGQVVRCVDHRDGGVVAIKIIRNKKRFHQQALVEVAILGRLREWDPDGSHATLSISCSFYFRYHLCIVTPCLSINLYELIRAHNFVGFSLPVIRRFSRQLLSCLTLLQRKRIIHCDLKPENILLCEARKADVRVIDFGSSCRDEEKVYTYIQSRFYRSPEVILGSSYGLGIDMWSLGCILAELWTGYPIFPGENEQEQLACIMEIFGPPDRHLVERCTRKKLFFDSVGKPRVTVSSKGRRRRPSSKTLQQALKTEDEAFVDFISRCLRWDPERRMKPAEAVTHPFITNLPMNQRSGIPDEARRAARLRTTTTIPVTNGQTSSSPIKRHATTASNAFAAQARQHQQQQHALPQTTPGKDNKPRATLPATPQTAVRNTGNPSTLLNQAQGSPIKKSLDANANRRLSTAASAAMAGSKRASSGAVPLNSGGGNSGGSMPSLPAFHQHSSSRGVAHLAAQQSMSGSGGGGAAAAAAAAAASARWRS